MSNKGFTLVELAVVITIIGLLIVGIISGATLIRQAELKTVITELQVYKTAYTAFKSNYKSPPGDITNADTLWAGNCAVTISCNGDGNFAINAYYGSATNETAKAWKHLNRAQLLNYQIIAVPSSYTGVLNFDLAPKSKIGQYGYYMAAGSDIGGDFGVVASPFNSINAITNGLFLGAPSASGGFTVGALNANDAYSIDKKVDDGKIDPAGNALGSSTGLIQTIQDQNGGTTCINAGNYNVTANSTSCIIGLRLD